MVFLTFLPSLWEEASRLKGPVPTPGVQLRQQHVQTSELDRGNQRATASQDSTRLTLGSLLLKLKEAIRSPPLTPSLSWGIL